MDLFVHQVILFYDQYKSVLLTSITPVQLKQSQKFN